MVVLYSDPLPTVQNIRQPRMQLPVLIATNVCACPLQQTDVSTHLTCIQHNPCPCRCLLLYRESSCVSQARHQSYTLLAKIRAIRPCNAERNECAGWNIYESAHSQTTFKEERKEEYQRKKKKQQDMEIIRYLLTCCFH